MLLSKLVYYCIKNVVYLDDISFTYDNFILGNYDESADYGTYIQNVFLPLNEAIARLSDLERIPYRIESIIHNSELPVIETSELNGHKVKEVISVAQAFRKIFHKPYGIGKTLIFSYWDKEKALDIEFKEDIPFFDNHSYYYKTKLNDEGVKVLDDSFDHIDIELENYGLNSSVCNYLMEYVMGKLAESMAPELANMHITRAETYFSNIAPVSSAFTQAKVENKFKIGE